MRPNLILGLRLVLNFLKGSAEAVGDLHVVYYFYLHIKWTRNKQASEAVKVYSVLYFFLAEEVIRRPVR